MLSRVKKCLCFFELLIQTYKITPSLSKTLLGKATKAQLVCIAEVVLNTLDENLEISSSTRRALLKGKRVLRKVARVARLMLADKEEESRPRLLGSTEGIPASTTSSNSSHEVALRASETSVLLPQRRQRKSSIKPERVQALKSVCLTHYKTLIEFLHNCLPYLKRLTGEPAVTSRDDTDDEIQ